MITHGTFLHESCDFYFLRALQSSAHGTKAEGIPRQRDMKNSGHKVISSNSPEPRDNDLREHGVPARGVSRLCQPSKGMMTRNTR